MKTIATAKAANFTCSESVTAEQLKSINLFTRRELSAEEVYVFSVILCDNEVDRDGEQFPESSLEALGGLFVGKTGVFDHNPKAENQSARIFETALVRGDIANSHSAGLHSTNSLGEPYVCLKAWAYTVRCDKNIDLILEIDAGIKKEVSVGCAVGEVLCSICGTDQKVSTCNHKKGETYDGALCCHRLVNPTDAYEWSFVAVPAQKNAGVTKTKKYKKGEFILELSKLFEQKHETVLSKDELDSLKKQYEELESLAEAGKIYAESLRRDIVKLASLAEPSMPSQVVEAMTEKLSIAGLSELQKSFGKIAARSYPVSPQLGGRTQAAENAVNSQFKI